ncbi:hypothetical protein FRC07_008321 [Ceratobasidium sp. 392]|nr:hypothetical protein FRC07_008321 [Ceratobasidium sp. 392]
MPGPLSDPGYLEDDILADRGRGVGTPDEDGSRHPSQAPQERQNLARRQRGRSRSEVDERDIPAQGPSKKRCIDVANNASDTLGLEDHEREELKTLSQLDTHAICIWQCGYILLLARQQADAECQAYLHGEYKGHATRKLQSILMEPTLASYGGSLTSRIVRYIQDNPDSFGVPEGLVKVPGSGIWSRTFWRAVGRTLTVFRSEILKKTRLSLDPKSPNRNIVALTKLIAPSDFIIKKAHWIRISFVRVYVIRWIAEGKPEHFWKFIDKKIDKLADLGDHDLIMRYLEKILADDQKKYPAPAGKTRRGKQAAAIIPLRTSMPVWQRGTAQIAEAIEVYQPHQLDPNIPNDEENHEDDEEEHRGDEEGEEIEEVGELGEHGEDEGKGKEKAMDGADTGEAAVMVKDAEGQED